MTLHRVTPCKACGATDRDAGYHCRPCAKKRLSEHYLTHKQQMKDNATRWKRAHVGLNRAYSNSYVAKHRDQVNASSAQYRKNNPQKRVMWESKRRARKAGAAGTCSATQLQARVDYYGGFCWVCLLEGKRTPYEAIDHVIPLAKGGSNWPSNLRPICTKHNSSKAAKLPREFLEKVI